MPIFHFIIYIIYIIIHIAKVHNPSIITYMFKSMFTSQFSGQAGASEGKNIFTKAAEWCLAASAFLLPLWFWPNTLSPVEFNKALMLSVLVFAAFLCYLAQAITFGKIKMPFHWSFLLLFGSILVWLASALTSKFGGALWGLGSEPTSFLSILVFSLYFLMIGMVFNNTSSLFKIFSGIFLGMMILIVGSLLSAIGWLAWAGALFSDKTFNTIGSWNSLSLAAGFFILMLYPFVSNFSKGFLRWVLAVAFVLSLILMAIVNFQLAWIIMGFFALVILSYSIWRRNVSAAAIGIPMLILLFALFGFFFNDYIATNLTVAAPAEVSVNYKATLDVAKEALKASPLLGSGPGTFGYLWDQYKPAAVNNTVFWGIRFTSGASYLLSMPGEVGFIAWGLFLVFIALIWHKGIRSSALQSETLSSAFAISAFLAASYMLVVWSFYPVGYALAAFGFLSFGLVLAVAHACGGIRTAEISLFSEGPKGLVSAMAVVVLIIGSFGGLYVVSSKYIGQSVFQNGLDAFNSQGKADIAEQQMLLASRSDSRNDIYFRNLSQLYMIKARLLLQDNSTPKELLGSQFKDMLDKAVVASKSSISANPLDFGNYRALGKIYEFLVPLNAAGAVDAAISQYDEAIKRSPKNPLIYNDKALVYMSDATARRDFTGLKKAEEALLKAIDLKPDYTDAHFLLAQVFDAEGNQNEAIRRSEAAALLAPNDIGSLFQLGLLYYKNNRLEDAGIVLERAISINNNYSNARYFLGLVYDRQKRTGDAIGQFEKIAELNPGNEEVKRILSNLRRGKGALSGIAPPAKAPDKRNEPPISESSSSGNR